MTLRVGFQADPLSHLNKERDTSLCLAKEAYRRGYQVFFFTPSSLQLLISHSAPYPTGTVQGHELFFSDLQGPSVPLHYETGPLQSLETSSFDILFVRQDPPVTMSYITTTYLLDFSSSKTLVINNPTSIRNSPEKLLPFYFPDLMPPTLISKNRQEILSFLNIHHKLVAKSLYNGAGRDIFLLNEDDPNLNALLSFLSESSSTPYLFQKYLPEISQGDTRIFLFNGQIIGAYKRFAQRDFRSNECVGGALEPYDLSSSDHTILSRLIPFLKERNILMAGIDLIGNFLTEINVTSPSGLVPLQKLYGTQPQSVIWDAIEDLVKSQSL